MPRLINILAPSQKLKGAGTIEATSFLSLSGSPASLFVQCWTGEKGQKSAPLLQGIVQQKTFVFFVPCLTRVALQMYGWTML